MPKPAPTVSETQKLKLFRGLSEMGASETQSSKLYSAHGFAPGVYRTGDEWDQPTLSGYSE
jgi:hypothetical protein